MSHVSNFEDDPYWWKYLGDCRREENKHVNFYPHRGESSSEAKEVCKGCPVRIQCRDYAIEHKEKNGIWGGTSERERRSLRRDNNAQKRARGEYVPGAKPGTMPRRKPKVKPAPKPKTPTLIVPKDTHVVDVTTEVVSALQPVGDYAHGTVERYNMGCSCYQCTAAYLLTSYSR